MTRSW
jgi:hypothetical protein